MNAKHNYVCVPCKKVQRPHRQLHHPNICPNCQCKLTCVGSRYPIPKKSDFKAWKKLEKDFQSRIKFYTELHQEEQPLPPIGKKSGKIIKKYKRFNNILEER